MQLPLPHSSWLCVPYVVITPFLIASRGTEVSRWHPRCLSILYPSRSKGFELRLELDSPLCLSHFSKSFSPLSFTCHRLSLTKFSGTLPPVRRRDLARRRDRPHVTSGYSRVKSGTCFGRAHSRISHASMHAPFIIGTASKRMPKAAKFCCVYTYYVALWAQTRVVLLHHPWILLFLLKLPWKIDQFPTAPEETRLRLKSRLLSLSRRAGNFFQADRRFLHDVRKNITLLQGRIVYFQKFFFRQFTKTIGFTYP